jgi:DNA-binding NarL/FixJ family response regulator
MKLPRVMLADDHTMLLEAFARLLDGKCDIVAMVSDGRALVERALVLKPEIIIVDISMPFLNGLEAARVLKEKLPAAKLVFLTMNEDPDFAVAAMRGGASAYLLKKSAASELFHVIQDVLKGQSYVTPQIARGVQQTLIRNPRRKSPEKVLTKRQREVVQLLAEGKSMKEAADLLKVTPRTVAFHKYRIMEELGLKTSADLVQFAIKTQIVVV